MYSLNLLAIALELAKEDPVLRRRGQQVLGALPATSPTRSIISATTASACGIDEDGFFYDVLHMPDGSHMPLKIRSMVGLIPLFAVETLESSMIDKLPGFKRRMEWFVENRPDLTANVACMKTPGAGERRLLSIVNADQLRRVLQFMLDENEFLFALRHPRAVAASTRTSPTCCTSTAASIASTTSRANRAPACSAAIRTGADRSGSR